MFLWCLVVLFVKVQTESFDEIVLPHVGLALKKDHDVASK